MTLDTESFRDNTLLSIILNSEFKESTNALASLSRFTPYFNLIFSALSDSVFNEAKLIPIEFLNVPLFFVLVNLSLTKYSFADSEIISVCTLKPLFVLDVSVNEIFLFSMDAL